MKKIVLFACSQMQKLAESIANQHAELIELGCVKWDKFRDGYPKPFICDVGKMVKNRDVVFLASFDQLINIFEQLSVIYALPNYLARSLKIFLPYCPTATNERVDREGEVATAVTLARLFRATPTTKLGRSELVIFDIHDERERFYFSNDINIVCRLESVMPFFKQIVQEKLGDDFRIAFPDEGAFKRFEKFFPDNPKIICEKRREGDKRIVRIKEGSAEGRRVVIVDDLVRSGETLEQCRIAIMNAGASEVACISTHMPEDGWKRFVNKPAGEGFSNFWISNSCPRIAEEIGVQNPFQIISLSTLIGDIITE